MGRMSYCQCLALAVLLLLLMLIQRVTSFGYVDYNDECEAFDYQPETFVSRLEEWKYCDNKRGLYCVPGLGRCGCLVPHTIYRSGKCRAKVNAGCLVNDYKLECVEHAKCTKNTSSSFTFRCLCENGYLSNAENTACFSKYEWDYRRKKYWYRDKNGYNYFGNGMEMRPYLLFILVLPSVITVIHQTQ